LSMIGSHPSPVPRVSGAASMQRWAAESDIPLSAGHR
jgi:hypothetical protein